MYYVNAAIAIAVLTMPCWLLIAWAAIDQQARRYRRRARRHATTERMGR